MNKKSAENIKIAEQETIDQYEAVAQDFFAKILNLDLSQCLITDESSLSDFHGSSLEMKPEEGYEVYLSRWDEAILNKIQESYGLSLTSKDLYAPLWQVLAKVESTDEYQLRVSKKGQKLH